MFDGMSVYGSYPCKEGCRTAAIINSIVKIDICVFFKTRPFFALHNAPHSLRNLYLLVKLSQAGRERDMEMGLQDGLADIGQEWTPAPGHNYYHTT